MTGLVFTPPHPKSCTWREGPPPSIGWWPASVSFETDLLRWWDGSRWSWGVSRTCSALDAGRWGRIGASVGDCKILWTDRWWPQ